MAGDAKLGAWQTVRRLDMKLSTCALAASLLALPSCVGLDHGLWADDEPAEEDAEPGGGDGGAARDGGGARWPTCIALDPKIYHVYWQYCGDHGGGMPVPSICTSAPPSATARPFAAYQAYDDLYCSCAPTGEQGDLCAGIYWSPRTQS